MASYDDLLKQYRKLAKRADQRLVRLEAYGQTKPAVLDWAYKKAMHDIKLYGGKEATRFNIKPPAREAELKRKISAIENFLNMDTSTKAGIRNIEKKRVASVNKSLNTDFSVKEWEHLHESGIYAKLIEKYGFYSATEALGTIDKNADEIEQMMKEAKEQNISLSEVMASEKPVKYDAILSETIESILTKEGLKIEDLK